MRFGGLAAQHDLAALSQVCFEFIKHAFDFPALGIEGREFLCGSLLGSRSVVIRR